MARKTTKSSTAGRRRAGTRAARPGAAARHNPVEVALAALAHEVRTPLNGMLALAQLLATSDLPDRERGWACALREAGEHLAQLTSLVVDGALAPAKAMVLQREKFGPRALVRSIAASLAARAQARGLTVVARIAEDLPETVVGDPVRLRAMLENLVDNAVKFTPQGRVKFAVAARPVDARRVRLAFTVEDQGIGLSKAEIDRLFRPFKQASREVGRRFGGAGLGLSLTRNIARMMGGDLTVRSREARGSLFRLNVIVETSAGDSAGAAEATPPGSHPAADPRLRILCAEDNPYGRIVLHAIAASLGHAVDFVADGEHAVARAREGRHDLVLMDLTLPGIGGLEATRRIRALAGAAGTMPIVGISGKGRARDQAAGRAAGMNHYLVKPVSPAALAQVLRAIGRDVKTDRSDP